MTRKVDQLPGWFSLERYGDLEMLADSQLAEQLYMRSFMFERHKCFQEFSLELLNFVKQNPIIPCRNTRNPGSAGWGYDKSGIDERFQGLFGNYVVPLTCDSAATYHSLFSDETGKALKLDDAFYDSELSGMPFDCYLQAKGISYDGIFNVCIDLGVPDEALIDEFRSYLESARTVFGYPQTDRISNKTSSRIIRSKVIPYLDLIKWAEVESLQIPDHIMGEWLFPDDMVDVAEKIRKTTRPLAKKVISRDFINYLGASRAKE